MNRNSKGQFIKGHIPGAQGKVLRATEGICAKHNISKITNKQGYIECAECRKEYKNTEGYKESHNNYCAKHNKQQRITCLNHYGNKCACCGENKYEFLVIDHIKGGGNKHRMEIGRGAKIYRWLIKNNFPEGFRVLCHNCNQSIGIYGYCPHTEESMIQ